MLSKVTFKSILGMRFFGSMNFHQAIDHLDGMKSGEGSNDIISDYFRQNFRKISTPEAI
jgi:hypothetical protein